jgi:multidrug efflux system outer membrane protein
MRSHRIGPALVTALALTGCALGPDYRRPDLGAPEQHRGVIGRAEAASLADLPWWQVFGDATLQALVSEAVANNRDLRAAVQRVEVASAQVGVARSPLFPWLGYEGQAARAKNQIQLGDVSTLGGTSDVFLAGVGAFWELDLWGRVRRSTEAARGELLATEGMRRGVLASVVAQVAQAYFELLELDLELEITRRSAQNFQETRDLFQRRFTGGASSQLPVTRAESLRAQTAARIPLLEAQIVATENRISVLLGRTPGDVPRGEPLPAQLLASAVPAGLPSALLERRPDVQEYEGILRAANAEVGVAVADFLPRIGLTGIFGTRSDELSKLTDAEGDEVWALAGSVTGSIFQGGFKFYRWRAAKRYWEEAKASYEQVVLNAFREVSDVLVLREKLALERIERDNAVQASRESVRLSRVRYDGGLAGYFEVLDAQQLLFPVEVAQAQSRLAEQLAIVELYRALGGGWQQPVPASAAPPSQP